MHRHPRQRPTCGCGLTQLVKFAVERCSYTLRILLQVFEQMLIWEPITVRGKTSFEEAVFCRARMASATAAGMRILRQWCFLGCQFKCGLRLISSTQPFRSEYSAWVASPFRAAEPRK